MSSNTAPKKVIFDTDGGGDDLWALLLLVAAHQRGEIELLGVTACFGNTSLDNAANNMLNFLYHCGVSDIPVFKGAYRTLNDLRGLADGAFGNDGLSKGKLPQGDQGFSEISAHNFLVDKLSNTQDAISIIATGPATNIARAFMENSQYDRPNIDITWFGGAILPAGGDHKLIEKNGDFNRGNITPKTEFNAGNDVPAAKIITSLNQAQVTIVPMDPCQHAVFGADHEQRMILGMAENGQKAVAENLIAFLAGVKHLDGLKQNMQGTPIYDAQTVQYFFNPELFVDADPLQSVDFVEKEELVPAFLKVADEGGFAPELLQDHGLMTPHQTKDGQKSNIKLVAGPYTFSENPSEDALQAHITMSVRRADALVEQTIQAAKGFKFS